MELHRWNWYRIKTAFTVLLIFFPKNIKNIYNSSNSLSFGSFSWSGEWVINRRTILTFPWSLKSWLSGPQGERRSDLYEIWTPEGKTNSYSAWAASKEAIGILKPNRRGAQAISNYVASHSYNFVICLVTNWIYCRYESTRSSSINAIISVG